MSIQSNVERQDWPAITSQLDQEGYAVVPSVLDLDVVKDLAGAAASQNNSTQSRGNRVATELRTAFFERLRPVSSRWNQLLAASQAAAAASSGPRGTHEHDSFHFSRHSVGDFQALHQWEAHEQDFPLQLVGLLSDPDRDFTGGEFVMTEQRPRMQSRPIVLPLRKGDVAIIAVAHRPHKGSAGYYRVNLKHAISRVRTGQRLGFEMLFNADQRGWGKSAR